MTASPGSAPILHLSLPVADVGRARGFYVDLVGCTPGRVRDGWVDVWFFGLQLTLQHDPDHVMAPEATGVRHFGVTLDAATLVDLLARLEAADVDWVHRVTTDHAGTPREQTKAKVRDPDGNVVELKSYADPAAAFEHLDS
ncbi:MAG TPA: VOC family protein [Acidimicrobiales bacterium]|nr:VOC family protein [Acidimicrobiales bacterium]